MADTSTDTDAGTDTSTATGRWSGLRSALDTAVLLLREDPLRGGIATALVFAGALSGPLLGVALAALVDAGTHREVGTAVLAGGCVGLLTVIQMTMGHFASMLFGDLGEKAMMALQARLVRSVQGSATLSRQEDSGFADRLSLLRQEVHSLPYIVQGILQTAAVVAQMLLTIALLGRLQPLLALLPLAALAPYYAGRYANRSREHTQLRHAEARRRAHALLDLAQKPGPMLEIRLAGLSGELQQRQRDLLVQVSRGLLRDEVRATWARTAGQLVFAAAYGTALVLVVRRAVTGHGSAGDVVLAIVLARQVASGVSQILSLTWTMQNAGRIGTRLRGLLADTELDAAADVGCLPAPAALRQGITVEGVGFRYPGTDADILRDLDLDLPAGSVVALVGENGAGKSTLVKLLCGLYRPTSGRISVDGTDLAAIETDRWRATVSAAFQDFGRFEFPAQRTVGIGDLDHVDDPDAVRGALRDAGAESLLDKLPEGLDTRIGKSFPDGRELSGGEWQKLALGRSMMRPTPVLLVLDEPTAALDAASEHQLFERHLARAREAARANGAVALFVSHRFSTVSMADHIVVLDDGAITEQGTHTELIAAHGGYAELFDLQARGYRDPAARAEGDDRSDPVRA